jgi:hypothetical protein
MSYNREKMEAAMNLALKSIYDRHNPPIADIIESIFTALISSVNHFIEDEDKNDLVRQLCDGLKEHCSITIN